MSAKTTCTFPPPEHDRTQPTLNLRCSVEERTALDTFCAARRARELSEWAAAFVAAHSLSNDQIEAIGKTARRGAKS
jgi:hypothetical protein